jgi:phosphatidylserine/phosphatidylglycerophosphate/cardiolipin synthase-like enzyme
MKKRFLLLILLLAVACTPAPPVVEAPVVGESPAVVTELAPGDLRVGYAYTSSWLDVYFTDPLSPYQRQIEGGVDEPLALAIRQARSSVDLAAYSLNLWSIRDALLDAQRRGVVVRLVMESSNMDDDVPQALMNAGIPIVGDRRDGLMHDKFVVIDGTEVWTGSLNFTVGGTYYDSNNLIRIRSLPVAENFTREFEEMFLDDKFGPDTVAETPNPQVTVNGVQIETFFSPDDQVNEAILPLLENARESIYFLAYSFTADDLGQAIRAAAQRGVQVRGVMDNNQIESNTGTEYDLFRRDGLDVRRDGLDGLMHHKVIIIDREIVITGSYNFSRSAEERNDENVVILYSPQIAQAFLDEFWRVYEHAVSE